MKKDLYFYNKRKGKYTRAENNSRRIKVLAGY
jgi:hypothetical protein